MELGGGHGFAPTRVPPRALPFRPVERRGRSTPHPAGTLRPDIPCPGRGIQPRGGSCPPDTRTPTPKPRAGGQKPSLSFVGNARPGHHTTRADSGTSPKRVNESRRRPEPVGTVRRRCTPVARHAVGRSHPPHRRTCTVTDALLLRYTGPTPKCVVRSAFHERRRQVRIGICIARGANDEGPATAKSRRWGRYSPRLSSRPSPRRGTTIPRTGRGLGSPAPGAFRRGAACSPPRRPRGARRSG
jgi:hypothetical protein